jgi:DNA-binding CsgD family transcriptional regulator
MGKILFSDLTEPQRRCVRELAEAEIADSPAWLPIDCYHKWTLRRLQSLDLVVVSRTNLDEPKVRITGRGMQYHREVLVNPPVRDKFTDDDVREIIRLSVGGMTDDEVAERMMCTPSYVSTIRRGAFPRAVRILAEMGIDPTVRLSRLDDEARKVCLKMRRKGASYAEIVEATGASMGSIGRWLAEAGMVEYGHVNDDTRRRVVKMAMDGMTYVEIAESLGRSTRIVTGTMKQFYLGLLDMEAG